MGVGRICMLHNIKAHYIILYKCTGVEIHSFGVIGDYSILE